MYESPVNVIMGEMQMQVEGEIYKASLTVWKGRRNHERIYRKADW